ncbi:hypothetical protein ASG60_08015 [Methylobacterium sp. Leaf469]|uniref:hypothetical protein n=1 Tax=Methylobacterium sp. Leaf469 TaxID=1736387 RepID=UPI0006FC2328|nr:hypothetical protein [Methylobacterium sp. Leaf469]KQT93309.1 hypothetical protein ASG60_08015 [Methylobacterium sp. Leaf469]
MTARIPATDKGTADRIEADDGGYWVRLVTWQALDREGTCMQHCVGDGGYDDLVGGEDLHDDAIWSLRDRDGLSILTVRIRHRELNYAKGPFNHAPGRGASMQVRHLVAAFKAVGRCLDVSTCETEIVLLEDGRTFRHDRLPPEVQAERDAALQQRGPMRLSPYQAEITWLMDDGAGPASGFDPFATTARESDPVVRVWATFESGGHTYVTRSGIRFTAPFNAFGIVSAETRREAFLQRYRAAVGAPSAAPPSGSRLGEVMARSPSGSGGHPGGGGGGGYVAYERATFTAEWVQVQDLQGRILGPAPRALPWSEDCLTDPFIRIDPHPDAPGHGAGGGGGRIEILGETNVLGFGRT